jgi:hypothetical protein
MPPCLVSYRPALLLSSASSTPGYTSIALAGDDVPDVASVAHCKANDLLRWIPPEGETSSVLRRSFIRSGTNISPHRVGRCW